METQQQFGCPHCGHLLDPHATMCPNCGNALTPLSEGEIIEVSEQQTYPAPNVNEPPMILPPALEPQEPKKPKNKNLPWLIGGLAVLLALILGAVYMQTNKKETPKKTTPVATQTPTQTTPVETPTVTETVIKTKTQKTKPTQTTPTATTQETPTATTEPATPTDSNEEVKIPSFRSADGSTVCSITDQVRCDLVKQSAEVKPASGCKEYHSAILAKTGPSQWVCAKDTLPTEVPTLKKIQTSKINGFACKVENRGLACTSPSGKRLYMDKNVQEVETQATK